VIVFEPLALIVITTEQSELNPSDGHSFAAFAGDAIAMVEAATSADNTNALFISSLLTLLPLSNEDLAQCSDGAD